MNIILWTSFNSILPIRGHGAYAIASWIRENGYTVKVIDFCHTLPTSELINITKKYVTDDTYAIAVSSTFMLDTESKDGELNRINYNAFAEPKWLLDARCILEQEFPNLDWIVGGSNSYLSYEKEWIKIHGYGEDQILHYLNKKSTKSVENKFDILSSNTRYGMTDTIIPSEVLNIEASRGCQFKCSFCRYAGIGKKKGTYIRRIDHIRDELIYNYENFGTTSYTITCDTFNESQEKVLLFSKMVKTLPFKLSWVGYNRLDLIHRFPEQIDLLKDSGMIASFFGIESFNKVASKAVGKAWNGTNAKNFLLKLKQRMPDVTFTISLIAGLPGETESDVRSSVDWLLDNDFKSFVVYPLSINRTLNGDKSIFDLSAEQYGYSFPKPLQPGFWKNEHFDILTANVLTRRINRETEHLKIAPAFLLPHLLNAGYIPGTPYLEFINSEKFKTYSNDLIDTYTTGQLK